jgi:hypothetical protein
MHNTSNHCGTTFSYFSFCLITPNFKNLNRKILYACVARRSTNDVTATGRSRLEHLAPDGSVSRGRDVTQLFALRWRDVINLRLSAIEEKDFMRLYCVKTRINIALSVGSDCGKT